MAFLGQSSSTMSLLTFPQVHRKSLTMWKSPNPLDGCTFPHTSIKLRTVCCTNSSAWEPAPVTYALTDAAANDFLKGTTSIFGTLNANKTSDDTPLTIAEDLTDTSNQPSMQLQYLRWPMWVLGPPLLLATGMVPTLWLPISSIFLGPNVVSLLSLTGLDCIFNLGASLFLLMADSCARPKTPTQACSSQAPLSYRLWNTIATITGFIIPLTTFLGSHNGFLQPQLSFISFAVLLGPYLLLLSVQILTEMLTWHWQSPVWLVTPVVYEAYRVLQLMRGLKLGAELSAPAWMMHTVRGLVCWWVLVLGMQLMRVAWYAGFTARARQQQSSASADDKKP